MTAAPEIDPRKSVIVLVLAVITVVICWMIPSASEGDDTGVVMNLPDHVGLLAGFPAQVSQAELAILPPDTTFARQAYGSPDSNPFHRILCSIVLSGREKRSIHRPERCLPGQGWSVIGSTITDVPLASGHPLKATALLLSRPVTTSDGKTRNLEAYYLYWYVGRDVSTPYSFERVLLTNWDLVVHRKNQRWAYIIYMGYITQGFEPDGKSPEETLAGIKDFIRQSAPFFVKSEMPGDDVSDDASASDHSLAASDRSRK
jgi:hypothetical protein